MSIAISVVVIPSKSLRAAVAAMSAAVAIGAGMIGFGHIGDFHLFIRLFVAGSCMFAAFIGFYSASKTRKTFRLDISDIGQIRLEEYIGLRGFSSPTDVAKGKMVCLMPDSTIWSHVLLLRLRSEDNQVTVLPILRDCVERDAFRALSIACRWIATQNNHGKSKQI